MLAFMSGGTYDYLADASDRHTTGECRAKNAKNELGLLG